MDSFKEENRKILKFGIERKKRQKLPRVHKVSKVGDLSRR